MFRNGSEASSETMGAVRMMVLVSIAVILVLTGSPNEGAAQEPAQLEGKEVFTSTSMEIGSFALSPDGRWIAFVGHPFPDQSPLYVVPAEGGDPIRITQGGFNDSRPAWSPDTRFLYFISDRTSVPESGTLNLMRVPFNSNSGQAAGTPRLISTEEISTTPVVSPDGKWVAYGARVSGSDERRQAIRVLPAQGGASRELARVRSGEWAFSEDSRSLLYLENHSLLKTHIFYNTIREEHKSNDDKTDEKGDGNNDNSFGDGILSFRMRNDRR